MTELKEMAEVMKDFVKGPVAMAVEWLELLVQSWWLWFQPHCIRHSVCIDVCISIRPNIALHIG